VIVDLTAEAGGNCELTEPDRVVVKHGVTIYGPTNLPTTMPVHATLYEGVYRQRAYAAFTRRNTRARDCPGPDSPAWGGPLRQAARGIKGLSVIPTRNHTDQEKQSITTLPFPPPSSSLHLFLTAGFSRTYPLWEMGSPMQEFWE